MLRAGSASDLRAGHPRANVGFGAADVDDLDQPAVGLERAGLVTLDGVVDDLAVLDLRRLARQDVQGAADRRSLVRAETEAAAERHLARSALHPELDGLRVGAAGRNLLVGVVALVLHAPEVGRAGVRTVRLQLAQARSAVLARRTVLAGGTILAGHASGTGRTLLTRADLVDLGLQCGREVVLAQGAILDVGTGQRTVHDLERRDRARTQRVGQVLAARPPGCVGGDRPPADDRAGHDERGDDLLL